MSNAPRSCPTIIKSALSFGRKSLAQTRPSQSNPFSARTYVGKTRPSTPRSSNATTQQPLQSPRAPQSSSPFTPTGVKSEMSKSSTQPAPDSCLSPHNTDVNTEGGGSLQFEQRPASAAENSMQGRPHRLPSNASPSLDQREPTLSPAQCKAWTAWSLAQDRIATGADGGITLRKP
jgi:hypothetical protein